MCNVYHYKSRPAVANAVCADSPRLALKKFFPRQYVRSLPAPLSFEGGATLPYCGMLAWDMLVTAGCLFRLSLKWTEGIITRGLY